MRRHHFKIFRLTKDIKNNQNIYLRSNRKLKIICNNQGDLYLRGFHKPFVFFMFYVPDTDIKGSCGFTLFSLHFSLTLTAQYFIPLIHFKTKVQITFMYGTLVYEQFWIIFQNWWKEFYLEEFLYVCMCM